MSWVGPCCPPEPPVTLLASDFQEEGTSCDGVHPGQAGLVAEISPFSAHRWGFIKLTTKPD